MSELTKTTNIWMRQLEIRLFSKLFPSSPIIYGRDYKIDENGKKVYCDQLNISVEGHKKVASTQNYGTVAISNLTYSDIVKLVQGEYYNIEIWAGYKSSDMYCYFSGEVAYVTQKIASRRDYTCYLIFASRFVAAFSQKRINFNVNSSINIYSAYDYIFRTAGVENTSISPELKNKFLTEVKTAWGTAAQLIDLLDTDTGDWSTSSDSSCFGDTIDVSTTLDKRRIRINNDNIIIANGNPTVDKNGLSIKLMPTFNYIVGDIIIVDNALIDISESNLRGAQTNWKSNFLDRSIANSNLGAYMIREINFKFENHGSQFQMDVLAKSVSYIQNLLGET